MDSAAIALREQLGQQLFTGIVAIAVIAATSAAILLTQQRMLPAASPGTIPR